MSAQPERRGGMGGIHRHDTPGRTHQQRRRVSAVHHLQMPCLRISGHNGGDEVVGTEVARQAPLDPGDDGEEVGLVVGGLLEDTQDECGGAHGRQPLAAHIPDDQPDAVRSGQQRVEIPADTGLRRRRAVADRHLKRPDRRRYRPEQRVLGGLRDRADGREHPLTTSPQSAGQATRESDGRQPGQYGHQFAARQTVPDPERGTQHRGEETDAQDPARPTRGGGQRGPGHEQESQITPAPPTRPTSTTPRTISTDSTGVPEARCAAARVRADAPGPATRFLNSPIGQGSPPWSRA